MKSMPFGDLVSAGAGHPQQSPCWREVLLEELAGAADSGPLRPLLKWLTVGFQLRRGTGEENQKSSRSYPPPPPPRPLYVLQHLTCCTSGAIGILTIGQKMRNTEHSSLGALITSFVK